MTAKVSVKTVESFRPRIDWKSVATLAAFALLLALTAARAALLEMLRDPFDALPGATGAPRGATASTSLLLDLLCCVPALLVLLRRAIDNSYLLRKSWAAGILFALAGWMGLSAIWASDKFAAVVSWSNFLAAAALLWAACQLVRSWMRLRIVAALGFGILLICLVQGFTYKFIDLPYQIQYFHDHIAQIFRERGMNPGSFSARQFQNKIIGGEMIGFTASANSFAAMIVLLSTLGAGILIQRRTHRDHLGWIIATAAPLPLAIWLLCYTQSKAAAVTVALALGIFLMIFYLRPKLAAQAKRWFWIGAGAVLLVFAAVVGHGLTWGRLPGDSLNFRWRYWTAAAHMFTRRPFRGVGWNNFGLFYLRDRLPAAAEEIVDPHNFLIRFFVELGLVGGILAVLWMLRLWWEMTRPIVPAATSSAGADRNHPVAWICGVAALAMLINAAASVDFSQDSSWIFLSEVQRFFYAIALAAGGLIGAMRALIPHPKIDERPSPWILYGLLAAIGVFLIHNLIEFSLFETGPMCLFALLAGSALGVRLGGGIPQRNSALAVTGFVAALVCWIVWAFWIIVPIARAESYAQHGDDALRQGNLASAFDDFKSALVEYPDNFDYALRAGRALELEPGKLTETRMQQIANFYAMAIDRNPSAVEPHLLRANVQMQLNYAGGALEDYREALALDPNEVSIRVEYARALAKMGRTDDARKQFVQALAYNNELDPAEPKRLSAAEAAEIKKEMGE